MRALFIIFLLSSCVSNISGPNYNQGTSHNKNKANRKGIVLREDSRMKNAMIKTRIKSTRRKDYNKHKRKKPNKRFI